MTMASNEWRGLDADSEAIGKESFFTGNPCDDHFEDLNVLLWYLGDAPTSSLHECDDDDDDDDTLPQRHPLEVASTERFLAVDLARRMQPAAKSTCEATGQGRGCSTSRAPRSQVTEISSQLNGRWWSWGWGSVGATPPPSPTPSSSGKGTDLFFCDF